MTDVSTLKVGDIMTRDMLTVGPDTIVSDAIRLMLKHRVSGLPVVADGDRLCGLLTEGDLLRRAELGTQERSRWLTLVLDPAKAAKRFAHAYSRRVGDVMTRHIVWVSEGTPMSDAIDAMEKCHLKRLPVLREGRLVGIISRADILSALASRMAQRSLATSNDRTIHRMLGHTLHEYTWSGHRPQFRVHDSVVDLYWIGKNADWERKAARIAAETIPGVREVRQHVLPG